MISAKSVAYGLILAFPVLLLTVKPLSIVIFALLVCVGAYVLFREKINPLTYPTLRLFSWLMLGYFAVMALSVALSHEVGNDWRHLSRISYFLFAPFVGVAVVYAEVPAKKMIYYFKLGVMAAGIIAFGDYLFSGGSGRFSGMYNPNTFGDIAVVMLFVALSDVWTEDAREYRWSLTTVLTGTTAVALSGSRGSMLAMILLVPVFLWLARRNGRRFQRAFVASLLMLFVLGANLVLTKTATDRIANIDNEIHRKESSAGQRLQMYKAGWKAFLDAPVIGYGYHNCGHAAARYADQSESVQTGFVGRWHLHNTLVTDMVNGGLMGLIALLSLYFVPLYIFFKNMHMGVYGSGGIIFVAGYVLVGLTHTQFGYAYETALFVLTMGYFLSNSMMEKNP